MTTDAPADAWSSGECPGDNTLASAIEGRHRIDDGVFAHLSRCGSCQELVAELLRETGGDDPRYRIQGLLGMGGMGLVLRAHDAVLDRAVALKLLWAAPPGSVEPVLAEARTLARFSHPNIVAVHDAGLLPRVGTPFTAMELVEGQTLREWLATPHGWREVVDVFLDAAAGLHAAHERGIVHADFKPANVLLPSDRGRARVTDFGLSRSVAEGAAPAEFVAGTPRYLAPEQRIGAAVAESDQYAFGIALHEALWGRHPRLAGSGGAPGCDGVPRRLRAVVARCIRDEPHERYPSMAELATRLQRATRRPVVPWVVGVALAVSGAVVWLAPDGTCTDHVQGRRDRWNEVLRPSVAAEAPGASDRVGAWVERWAERAELSCGHSQSSVVAVCLEERWATLEALVPQVVGGAAPGAAAVALAQLPSVEACRQPRSAEPRPDVAADRIARCASAIAQGRSRLLLGDPIGAEAALVEAIAMADAYGLLGLEARAQLLLAKSRWQAAKLDEAFDTFSAAAELAVRAGLPDLGALAMGSSAQYVAHVRRDAGLARRRLDQARALASRGSDPTTTVNLDRVEAWILSVEGDDHAAANLMRTVIERIEAHEGDNALAQSTNLGDLANFLSNAGQSDAALAEAARGLRLRREVLGESHGQLGGLMLTQASILQRADRFDEAAAVLGEVVTIWGDAYGVHSGAAALAALSRANVLLDASRFDEASVELEAASRVFLDPNSPDASKASLCEQLGARLALGQGRPRRARAILRGLIDDSVQRSALSAQRVALIHQDLGRSELALGNGAEAQRWLRRAMDTEHALDGTTRGELHFALAQALRDEGGCGEESLGAARDAVRAWTVKGTEHALDRAVEARAFIDRCLAP